MPCSASLAYDKEHLFFRLVEAWQWINKSRNGESHVLDDAHRNFRSGHQKLFQDYFSDTQTYNEKQFLRFRMPREVFLDIMRQLESTRGFSKIYLALEIIIEPLEDSMKEYSGGVVGEDSESYFHLTVTGQLESAYFPMGPDSGSLFCRYDIVAGPDWELVSGMRSGITQSAKPEGDYRTVVFNMPLEFTMKSTNPYGWPQIVFSMYGTNLWNVETNRGYARIHCPLSGMKRTVLAPLYVPKFSNIWSAAMSWITGVNPEMRDPKILADGSKHKGLASESYGELVIRLQAISRGCSKMALDWGQSYD